MQMITITGKQALHGRIRPAAAKNSTLPLLAATLLVFLAVWVLQKLQLLPQLKVPLSFFS